MKDLKLHLFNFKNELTLEQLDVSKIIQSCLENYDNLSEKELLTSLKNNLTSFSYFKEVKQLLETVEEEVESKPLIYDLKDLYKKVERKNLGVLYRQPLVTLLEIISRSDDDARMEGVLNELSMYDWVPEIKHFLMKMTSSPVERQNLQNSGKAAKIYTLVEKIENGHLSYISDRWFLISENEIKQVLADDYIKDDNKVREIRMLEKVLQITEIIDNVITFQIDENLQVGVSTEKKGIYLNGELLDKETTLETLFNSPIVPMIKRDYYALVEATMNNLDKFMELDVALRVSNLLKPFTESFVFNYKDKMYVYSKDDRYGTKFYAYESANELIHDIQQEFDYDLTYFYENKLSGELKQLRTLEDREQQINIKLQDVNESIDMLKENDNLMKENKELERTFNNLLVYKHKLTKELNVVKEEKNAARRSIIK